MFCTLLQKRKIELFRIRTALAKVEEALESFARFYKVTAKVEEALESFARFYKSVKVEEALESFARFYKSVLQKRKAYGSQGVQQPRPGSVHLFFW